MGINMFAHLFGGGRTPQAAPPGKPKGKDGKGKAKAEEEKKDPEAEEEEEKKETAEGDGEEGGDDEKKEDEEEGDGGEAASAAAVRQAVKAERARCIKIFSDPSAANNIPQACEMAFSTSLSADRVIAIMKTAAPPAKGGSLSAAMRGVQQPSLGDGGGGKSADGGTDDEAAKAMLATMRRAGMIPKEKR